MIKEQIKKQIYRLIFQKCLDSIGEIEADVFHKKHEHYLDTINRVSYRIKCNPQLVKFHLAKEISDEITSHVITKDFFSIPTIGNATQLIKDNLNFLNINPTDFVSSMITDAYIGKNSEIFTNKISHLIQGDTNKLKLSVANSCKVLMDERLIPTYSSCFLPQYGIESSSSSKIPFIIASIAVVICVIQFLI